MEEEAVAAIQPSRLPGTIIWEEAVHRFANMARTQMLANDPALVTYEMSVSTLRTLYFPQTNFQYFSSSRNFSGSELPTSTMTVSK